MNEHAPAGAYPIVIDVSNLDLNAVVDHGYAGHDDEGEPCGYRPYTLADAVADRIAELLVARHFSGYDMNRIRDEVIRAKLAPVVEAALHEPRSTRVDGVDVQRSFAELVAEVVRRQVDLFDRRDNSGYRPAWASPLRQEIEDAVTAQMQQQAAGVRARVDEAIRTGIAEQFATRLAEAVDDATATFRHAVLDATRKPAKR